jgi:hypothetical protein
LIGWLTALVIALVAALILWGAPKLAAGRKIAAQSGELGEGLQTLTRSLGLGACDRRNVFGDAVHRLTGEYNRLKVDLEVQVGRRFSYTRITIEFPQTLEQDLTILCDRKPALRNWVLRQKEVDVGVEDFDRDFILFARHEGRLKSLLSPAIRFQLHRLFEMGDCLEIGDETVFVLAREMTKPAEVSKLLKKTLETAERIYATAVQLGPSPSKMESTVYTKATSDIYSREEDTSAPGPSMTSSAEETSA